MFKYKWAFRNFPMSWIFKFLHIKIPWIQVKKKAFKIYKDKISKYLWEQVAPKRDSNQTVRLSVELGPADVAVNMRRGG